MNKFSHIIATDSSIVYFIWPMNITIEHYNWKNCLLTKGVLVFLNFLQNFSERQILWSLCSVDFHTLTFQLPIQTSLYVAPELPVS